MTAEPACTWFETTGVVGHERGEISDEAIAAHLVTCVFCQKTFTDVATLRRELTALPAARPRDHWEQAVWARIDAKRVASSRIAWRWAWLPVAAMGVAAFAIFGRAQRSPVEDGPVGFSYRFEKSTDQARTRGDVTVGDTLVMEATAINAPVAELRIYQDNAGLRFRCAGEPPCERVGQALRGRWKIPAVGRYRVMVATSPTSLPSTTISFDDDVGALAQRPGVELRTIDTFEVW